MPESGMIDSVDYAADMRPDVIRTAVIGALVVTQIVRSKDRHAGTVMLIAALLLTALAVFALMMLGLT